MTKFANQNKFASANEMAKQQAAKYQKQRNKAVDLILRGEEAVEVVLLDPTQNDVYVGKEHVVKTRVNGKDRWERVKCIDGLGMGECPLCQHADPKGRISRAKIVVYLSAIDPRESSYENRDGKTIKVPFKRVKVGLTAAAQRDVFARFYEKHGKKNNNRMRGLLVEFKKGDKKAGALGLPAIDNTFLSEEEILERFGTPARVSDKDPNIVYQEENIHTKPFNWDDVIDTLTPEELRRKFGLDNPFGHHEDEEEELEVEDDEIPSYESKPSFKSSIPFDDDEIDDEIPFN